MVLAADRPRRRLVALLREMAAAPPDAGGASTDRGWNLQFFRRPVAILPDATGQLFPVSLPLSSPAASGGCDGNAARTEWPGLTDIRTRGAGQRVGALRVETMAVAGPARLSRVTGTDVFTEIPCQLLVRSIGYKVLVVRVSRLSRTARVRVVRNHTIPLVRRSSALIFLRNLRAGCLSVMFVGSVA